MTHPVFQTSGANFNVAFDVDWTSDAAVFNYDTDMSTCAAARAFAKEPWNRQFFEDLKKLVHC